MDVGTVDQAVQPSDRLRVLEMVEASAKARNDLTVANDAHYDLAALRSNGYWWPWRMLDRGFYGGIAGYFVRPFRPMVTLLALAAILALVRTIRRRSASSEPRSSRPWREKIANLARGPIALRPAPGRTGTDRAWRERRCSLPRPAARDVHVSGLDRVRCPWVRELESNAAADARCASLAPAASARARLSRSPSRWLALRRPARSRLR